MNIYPDEGAILISEIDAVAAAMAGVYESLGPRQKPAVIRLGHALSALRRRVQQYAAEPRKHKMAA